MKASGLTMISIALTLVLLEGGAQLLMRPDQLYSRLHTNPERHSWHNEVEFWQRHHAAGGTQNNAFASFDPLLGWDFDRSGDRIRGTIGPAERPAGQRLLLIGDSFTHGTDVALEETFGSLLAERFPEVEVLNMAVPGYGIDQAYLKYRHFGAALRPDIIIFGIYVSDYQRSSLSFTTFAKPRFALQGGALVLENQPVPDPTAELARIGTALAGRSYLWALLENGWYRLQETQAAERAFFDQTDPVITGILASLQSELQEHQRLLIVHIPRAEAFIEEDRFRDQMAERLLAIYHRLGMTVINLRQAFAADQDAASPFQTHYVHFDNGSVGHLSPLGHQRVADLIARTLAADPE